METKADEHFWPWPDSPRAAAWLPKAKMVTGIVSGVAASAIQNSTQNNGSYVNHKREKLATEGADGEKILIQGHMYYESFI